MRPEGAIFDLDGTLTDSMYIWNEAPGALVRRFGKTPPENLAGQLKEMGRLEASEYLIRTFGLCSTPEQVMESINELVSAEYRERVPLKPGVQALLSRLEALGVPCGIQPGNQADLVLLDLAAQYTIDSNQFYSMGKSTPFDGWHVAGKVVRTIYRGQTVYVEE